MVPEPIDLGPAFCLVEEQRRFSQAELDWRAKNAPWNLRRDFATNERWGEVDCDALLEAVAAGEDG